MGAPEPSGQGSYESPPDRKRVVSGSAPPDAVQQVTSPSPPHAADIPADSREAETPPADDTLPVDTSHASTPHAELHEADSAPISLTTRITSGDGVPSGDDMRVTTRVPSGQGGGEVDGGEGGVPPVASEAKAVSELDLMREEVRKAEARRSTQAGHAGQEGWSPGGHAAAHGVSIPAHARPGNPLFSL